MQPLQAIVRARRGRAVAVTVIIFVQRAPAGAPEVYLAGRREKCTVYVFVYPCVHEGWCAHV